MSRVNLAPPSIRSFSSPRKFWWGNWSKRCRFYCTSLIYFLLCPQLWGVTECDEIQIKSFTNLAHPCRIINCVQSVNGNMVWMGDAGLWGCRQHFYNHYYKNGNLNGSHRDCVSLSLLRLLLWCAVCSDWANSYFTVLTTSSEGTYYMELRGSITNILQRTLWKQNITSKDRFADSGEPLRCTAFHTSQRHERSFSNNLKLKSGCSKDKQLKAWLDTQPHTRLNKPCWLGHINHTSTVTFTFCIMRCILNNPAVHFSAITRNRFILAQAKINKNNSACHNTKRSLVHFFPACLIHFLHLVHRGLWAWIWIITSGLDAGGAATFQLPQISFSSHLQDSKASDAKSLCAVWHICSDPALFVTAKIQCKTQMHAAGRAPHDELQRERVLIWLSPTAASRCSSRRL